MSSVQVPRLVQPATTAATARIFIGLTRLELVACAARERSTRLCWIKCSASACSEHSCPENGRASASSVLPARALRAQLANIQLLCKDIGARRTVAFISVRSTNLVLVGQGHLATIPQDTQVLHAPLVGKAGSWFADGANSAVARGANLCFPSCPLCG